MSRLFRSIGSPGGTAEKPLFEQLASKSTSEQLHKTAEGHTVESIDPATNLDNMVTRKTTSTTARFCVLIFEEIKKQTK